MAIDLGEGASIELVRISKGQFTQGSPESEQGREIDEAAREVTLSSEFYLGATPVTVGQFRRFVVETNHKTEAESGPSGGFGVVGGELVQQPQFNWRNPGYAQTDEHPVTIVTFADATAFLNWLSGKSGRTMILPTEAQWEYSCRAGSATSYCYGDDVQELSQYAWYDANRTGVPHAVGEKKPHAWGLYDMHGNVWEWCWDRYGKYPSEPVTDPVGPKEGSNRVYRGGGWSDVAAICRSAFRNGFDPSFRRFNFGFRVALSPSGIPK